MNMFLVIITIIDCIVIRHNASGCCYHIKEYVDSVIINAGDGMFEHPTQALLDIMSIKEKKGSIKNLNIGELSQAIILPNSILIFESYGSGPY